MFQLDPRIFGSLTSKADYDLQKQQLSRSKKMQDLQQQLLQKQVGATEMDLPTILGKAQQVGFDNLSPQEQQLVIGSDIAQMAKQTVDPRGNVITNRSYRDLLGMSPAQVGSMPPSAMNAPMINRTQGIVPEVGNSQIPQLSEDEFLNNLPMGVTPAQPSMKAPMPLPSQASAPTVDFMGMQNIDTSGLSPFGAEDVKKFQIQEQIKQQAEQNNTDTQKMSAQQVLNRLNQINEELLQLGAVVSEKQPMTQRVGAYIKGTEKGQEASKVADPKVQALREEFKNLQSTFLPFYASAAGLGAKSLDSEAERKSILDSFGNPAGIYEANRNQLKNLTELIGSGSSKKSITDYSDEELMRMLGE